MFNFFKKKDNSNSSPAIEDYQKAKEEYDKSDFSASLGTLIQGFKKDLYYRPLYTLASQCLAQLGGEEESVLFKNAESALSGNTFEKLGNHFMGVDHYVLAKVFLEEAFEKSKKVDVANSLAIASAKRFDVKTSQEVLERVKGKFDFWTFWFYVKVKMMNNDRIELRSIVDELGGALGPDSNEEQLIVPRMKVRELKEMYQRLMSVDEPKDLIRDWHYIQYGSVILDFFFAEDQYVAGGRYVATWGNNSSIRCNLGILTNLMRGKNLHQIVYGNDRNSEILGFALSDLMSLEASAYKHGSSYQNCLFVVGNSASFGEFESADNIEFGNITFAYDQNWLEATFICPDVIGQLSQMFSYPWSGGNFALGPDGSTTRTEADPRDSAIIAAEIVAAEITEVKELDQFYMGVFDHLKMNQSEGKRYNFVVESPVPGSYFGST